jgi:hypothetical protein
MTPQPYLTVASLLSGFGITVFMFRIDRELQVRREHPEWPNWLSWADYLVIANIVISLVLVVIPLVAVPEPGPVQYSIAGGGCAAAAILQLGYPFAILDHYRIEIGTWRTRRGEPPSERHKGEPIEKAIVIGAGILAVAVFVGIVFARNF